MTTLCLCDFVDVAANRECLLAPTALASPSTRRTATMVAAAIDPHLLPRLAVIHPTQEDFR